MLTYHYYVQLNDTFLDPREPLFTSAYVRSAAQHFYSWAVCYSCNLPPPKQWWRTPGAALFSILRYKTATKSEACTFQTANNLIFNVVAAKWSWFWWLSIKLVFFYWPYVLHCTVSHQQKHILMSSVSHLHSRNKHMCYYSCKSKSCVISLWGLVRKSTNVTLWTNPETSDSGLFLFSRRSFHHRGTNLL